MAHDQQKPPVSSWVLYLLAGEAPISGLLSASDAQQIFQNFCYLGVIFII